MKFERIVVGALVASAIFVGSESVRANPKEPLIVTQMADPDPYFVAPRSKPQHQKLDVARDLEDKERIDEAMQNLGRAIGEAAFVEQQQIEARCRQGDVESGTPEQRFAWAASCRYTRH